MTRFIQSTTLVGNRNRLGADQVEADGLTVDSKDIIRVLCHPAPNPQFSVEAKTGQSSASEAESSA